MAFDDLTENNILLYAAKCYDKPQCVISEFDEDYKRIRYVKRILQKYRKTREIKERLLLNHLVILQNVFGIEASTRMLFFRIDSRDYAALKTFLIYTSAMPAVVPGIQGKNLRSSDIPLDNKIVMKLRNL
jgi:hypothetical protein